MIDRPHVRDHTFQNWGRTERASLASFVQPHSEDELADVVAAATRAGTKVKAVGAGHSWSAAACTTGTLVSLDNMRRIHELDHRSGLVTVDAGLRLSELNEALYRSGRALPIVGSISAQSVAGVTATGTHGSGPRIANIASGIDSFRIVLADGSVRDVDAASDPDLFRAGRVGLGALGVISRLTFRTVPAFKLQEVTEPVPFDEAIERIPQLIEEEPFVKVWWLPHGDSAVIFRYRPSTAATTFSERQRSIDERVINRYVFPLALSAGRITNRLIPPMNKVIAGAYFKNRTTVGRSDRVLNVAMPPRHDEMEYALPVERAAESFQFMRRTIEDRSLRIDFIAELRFSAADDAWLSPGYERDSCWIGAYVANSGDRRAYLDAIEAQALEWDGRPHWGKRFAATGSQLRGSYKRWDDFVDLRGQLDPTRTFDNTFLQRLFH
jgi:L-gulono-1,4-lactone dehydrogenase